MPLKLVTGPANAAKAGAVLGPLRDRLADEPILVVPGYEDVEHSQRELARRGAIFGAQVLRFNRLFGLIAQRTGVATRRASDLQRRLIVEEAVRGAHLEVLAQSAARPGFARAAERLVAELGGSMVEPARFTRALRDWAGDGSRRRYAEELAEIYRRYRAGLEAAGLVDGELAAWRALDALRREPTAWGATPVFVYGFDDLDPLQLDALETLARHVDVTVSLPYEPGREAFRATAGLRERIAALADEVVQLEPLDDHYEKKSRKVLHALERGLFESRAKVASAGTAVGLHDAGGERAEIELCGARVLELLRDGTPPGGIAVVFRDPRSYGSLVEQVFGAYGIPHSIDRRIPLGHSSLGRGLLALLRCALLEGSAEDLLAYLRTPGLLREAALADRLEADVRRGGAGTAVEARLVWEQTDGRWPLTEIDRISSARAGAALLEALDARLVRMFGAPFERRARVLAGPELEDVRAFREARASLAQLATVAAEVSLDAARVHEVLSELRIGVGDDPQPDRVQITRPETIRARRFAAVFVCGLQEGEFPRGARPEAFLPDADRRDLARASGLRLPLREDELDRERYLFYVCASRAERLLVLSARYCDEEGSPRSRSPFVEDARAVLGDLGEHVRERSLGDVTWSTQDAPTEAEWERALARSGPRRPSGAIESLRTEVALEALSVSDVVSARALEDFASCPVRWLVDDVLRPEKLEPDPEQMVRGSYAHKVLELTFRGLREQSGDRRVSTENLPWAERLLLEAMASLRGEFRLAPNQTRVRAAVRRLEFDLLRYLRHEAARDGLFEPEHLELRFGLDPDGHPAVELEGGLSVRGVIDRVDVWNERALVRDYKSGRVESYKLADWERSNRFQVALYMIVVQRLLGLEPAGGVYVPLGGEDRRSRGMVSRELAEQLGSDFVNNDVLPEEDFAERTAWAQTAIAEVATRMRAGELRSCPDQCKWRGGCSHPSFCRVEG